VVDRQRAREVGEEDDARLQQADQERLATGVVGGDLRAQLADAGADLGRRQVDVADPSVLLGYGVSANRYRRARRSMSRR
jgi:hypothetical protein